MTSFATRALLALTCLTPAFAHADVFINEIHYDDSTAAGDVGEAIEVVATGGEDLTQYAIVLYNGSTPAAATTYDTDVVPAGSSASCGATVRVAVLNYPTNGIQNGSNDAIALVQGATVVQFLSYEGVATASNGPAAGMSSVDIGVSEPGTTTPGTSLQLAGTGSAYSAFAWQGSQVQTMGACNTGQTFSTPVDVPPQVATTTPANGASAVATSTSVSVSFSEPVTVTGNWFSIVCTTSGSHPAAVTGGPNTYTLNPDTDFSFSEPCTVTLAAAQIVDRDGTPDPLAADYAFGFTTSAAPVDVAPTVQSTTPTNNATNVAVGANVLATFSEPVALSGAWFTLDCAISGLHSAVVSGGPSSYTLNPDVDFGLVETCTFTVIASQVSDLDGTPNVMAANHAVSFTTSAGTGNYYVTVNASTCTALRGTLHPVIDDHTVYPYSAGTTDTWDILETADEDPSDTTRILDVYRNRSYAKGSDRAGTGSGITFNREHTWPNSLGFSSNTGNLGLPNAPYTDTHMLYLSDTGYNADRGNKPYAACSLASGCGERATEVNAGFGGGSGVYPGNSNWFKAPDGNSGSFEAWNHRKGDIARAVLYMDIRYEGGTHGGTGQAEPDLVLTDNRALIQITSGSPAYMGLLSDLVAWHNADPPDTREQLRNDLVFSFQGNRNPFIDHPEWVDCLFNCQCNSVGIFADGFE